MLLESLIEIYGRELNNLKNEILAYTDEVMLWETKEGIKNSGGNLCLHLIGNLNHFIGGVLGNTDYVRKRDQEFEQKNVPVKALAKEIDSTIRIIKNTLQKLSETDLEKTYPVNVLGKEMTIGFFLIHLVVHLSYHLGQINYHRRQL